MTQSAPDNWRPLHCDHGYLVLGCPHDDCPTQTVFIDQQSGGVDRRQWQAVLDYTESMLRPK